MQTFEEAVNKVVNFWVEKSFETILNQNNGDGATAGGATFALMNTLAMKAQKEVDKEQIVKFRERLTEILLTKKGNKYRATLSVDYDPCLALAEAAKYAEVSTMLLPIKTTSWIDDNNVATASYQYRGEVKEL